MLWNAVQSLQTLHGPDSACAACEWQEGIRGFYRGWAVNALKVVPSNAIRFVAYEAFKSLMGVQRAATDT